MGVSGIPGTDKSLRDLWSIFHSGEILETRGALPSGWPFHLKTD